MNEKNMQRKWDREEVVILVVEYFRTKNKSNKEIEETHQKISDFLRKRETIITKRPISDVFRDYAGIHMQSGRIRSLDPDTLYSGMQGTKLQKEVMQDYLNNPKALIAEADYIYEKYGEQNSTISYYDNNAEDYFRKTVSVDTFDNCNKFIGYLKPGDRIIDLGAGSGRDIAFFIKKGFDVDGIDASVEMCKLASLYSGIDVTCQKIQDWHPTKKYNGIWINASIMHLSFEEIDIFVNEVDQYMDTDGVLYISVKEGIPTGLDSEGRFFTAFSSDQIRCLLKKNTKLKIMELWTNEDKLNRLGFNWINVIAKKDKN